MLGSPSLCNYRDGGSYRDNSSSARRQLLDISSSSIRREDESYQSGRSWMGRAPVRRALIPARRTNDYSDPNFTSIPSEDNDRIHNALLEELCADFGVTDSTDIDFLTFDLPTDRLQAGRLPDDLEGLDVPTSFGHVAVVKGNAGTAGQRVGTSESKMPKGDSGVARTTTAVSRLDIPESVASPTISSSCEDPRMMSGSGEGMCESTAGVHSTTNCQSVKSESSLASFADENVTDSDKTIVAGMRSCRPSVDSQITELHMKKLPGELKREARDDYLDRSQSGGTENSSTASSPRPIVKRARIIASGGDLLEDVKQSYSFVSNVNMFAPQPTHQVPYSCDGMSTTSGDFSSVYRGMPCGSDRSQAARDYWNCHPNGDQSVNPSQGLPYGGDSSNPCTPVKSSTGFGICPPNSGPGVSRPGIAGSRPCFDPVPGYYPKPPHMFQQNMENPSGIDSRFFDARQQSSSIRPGMDVAGGTAPCYGQYPLRGGHGYNFPPQYQGYPSSQQQHVMYPSNQFVPMNRSGDFVQGEMQQPGPADQCTSGAVNRSCPQSPATVRQPSSIAQFNNQVGPVPQPFNQNPYRYSGSDSNARPPQYGGTTWPGGFSDSDSIQSTAGTYQHQNSDNARILNAAVTTPSRHLRDFVGTPRSGSDVSMYAGKEPSTPGSVCMRSSSRNTGHCAANYNNNNVRDCITPVCPPPPLPPQNADNDTQRSSGYPGPARNVMPTPAGQYGMRNDSSIQPKMEQPVLPGDGGWSGAPSHEAGGGASDIHRLSNQPGMDGAYQQRTQILADQQGRPMFQPQPSMTSGRGFVQHLIGEGSGPYRSHPLFPLLRDLVIADNNFDVPSFPYPLLAGLPRNFDRLISNYFSCNTRAANAGPIDPVIDNIVIDALRYAHSALIDKIRRRRLKEGHQADLSCPVDDVCNQFTQIGGPQQTVVSQLPNAAPGSESWSCPNPSPLTPMAEKLSAFPSHMPPSYGGQSVSASPPRWQPRGPFDGGIVESSPSGRQYTILSSSRSIPSGRLGGPPDYLSPFEYGGEYCSGGEKVNKSKVLPNEAKTIMTDWLRDHQDNPYPNDDEKEALMQSTKLTINQINYWFTNARRRLLPKWAMLRRHAQERDNSITADT